MPEDSPSNPDVTIVGAGIIGICSALSLIEAGLSVRLVDPGEPGQATSFGNAGVISPWSFVPQNLPGTWKNVPSWLLDPDGPVSFRFRYLSELLPWARRFLSYCNEAKVREISARMELLSRSNVEIYRRHLKGTGREDLLADSMYVHAFRDAGKASLDGLGFKLRLERGADIARIGAGELHELEPGLSSEFKAAILIKGQARARSPGKLGAVLAQKAITLGADYVRAKVLALKPEQETGWMLDTSTGRLQTKAVLVSAGAWSAQLLQPLGVKLPLVSERGYHVEFTDPGVELNNSVMDVENRVVASTMEGGLRVAGTSEFAALDAPPDESRYRSLTRMAQKIAPDINIAKASRWMGRRPSFPDNLPVLGPVPTHPGLFGAFGHCHYGMVMAPRSGQLIAQMIAGRALNEDVSGFSVTRFKR